MIQLCKREAAQRRSSPAASRPRAQRRGGEAVGCSDWLGRPGTFAFSALLTFERRRLDHLPSPARSQRLDTSPKARGGSPPRPSCPSARTSLPPQYPDFENRHRLRRVIGAHALAATGFRHDSVPAYLPRKSRTAAMLSCGLSQNISCPASDMTTTSALGYRSRLYVR